MKSYHMIFLFLITISIFASLNTTVLCANDKTEKEQDTLTQEHAAILASKIANKKFQKDFGISPFTPESYTAEVVDNKWNWGEISPAGINGCSAKVTFNKDGSNEEVKVAYHTDILEKEADTQKMPIEIEIIQHDDLNIDDHKEK